MIDNILQDLLAGESFLEPCSSADAGRNQKQLGTSESKNIRT
jgi:hypothetical protein